MQDTLTQLKFHIDSLDSSVFQLNKSLEHASDSVLQRIDLLEAQIENSKNEQTHSIELLSNKIDGLQPDLTHEFIIPLILSIVAGFIFWLFFSYIPELTRKKKIRKKIEFEIYQVYSSLFSLFDTVFSHQEYSPSHYQNDIRGGKLTSEMIEMALQNKCLNEHYFYDKTIVGRLMPIGKSLWDITRKTDQLIDRIFNFSFYLTSTEILLLDEIRQKLHTYDIENFDKDPATILGIQVMRPVNPSLSYMKTNLDDIYQLYLKLQEAVFKQKTRTRNTAIHKVQFLYYSNRFDETIKFIKSIKKLYPKDTNFLDSYLSLALYHKGEHDEAFELLEKLLKNGLHLVSHRSFLKSYGADERLNELLKKYSTESEIREFENVIHKEQLKNEQFVANSKQLKDYYKSKSKST